MPPLTKRLFFALDIQHHDKAMIEKWRDKLLALPFKPIEASNFHITLAFLGTTTSKQQQALTLLTTKLVKQLKEVQENTLVLDHLGLFKKPKVLYLGLKHCPYWLTMLAQQLSHAATQQGMHQESRLYCPHVSVYRKASPLLFTNIKSIALNIKITIDHFSLYESISTPNGVQYIPLSTWSL